MPLIAVIMLPVLITELDLVGFDEPYHSDLPPGISSPTSTAVLQLEEVIHTIKKLGIVKKGPHSSIVKRVFTRLGQQDSDRQEEQHTHVELELGERERSPFLAKTSRYSMLATNEDSSH